MIPFNKPYLSGSELVYIEQAIKFGKLSGNGFFTKKCHLFFEEKYGFKKVLLTTSCTDALEMCAILSNIQPGDEVIVPSFTFVSSALAFIRVGAKIVFVDSYRDHPNMDSNMIEGLITSKTKAIVAVHYAGVACDMDCIMELAEKYNLVVIEDAAQAIDSFYTGKDGKKRALGSIGHLAAFSFHETKNIISGEGGMLVINDERFIERSEVIWEKGTNRAKFFRGEINKYEWVDIGSSFLPSEIIAAFLLAQIENLEEIQKRRLKIWNTYFENLKEWVKPLNIKTPKTPKYATNNAHMFYLECASLKQRASLIEHLKKNKILAVTHYVSLHSSPFYKEIHGRRDLCNSTYFTDRLLRLPFYYELDVDKVINVLNQYEE